MRELERRELLASIMLAVDIDLLIFFICALIVREGE